MLLRKTTPPPLLNCNAMTEYIITNRRNYETMKKICKIEKQTQGLIVRIVLNLSFKKHNFTRKKAMLFLN